MCIRDRNVPYADKTVTEITCHGRGSAYLFGDDPCVVIDIGGQDTKIIAVDGGVVQDFLMNDKCSAGTGRFLEVMANTLAISPGQLCELARTGSGVTISSMCTVFAESEVISLIGNGTAKEDIAFGIVDSICTKVASQFSRLAATPTVCYLSLIHIFVLIQVSAACLPFSPCLVSPFKVNTTEISSSSPEESLAARVISTG